MVIQETREQTATLVSCDLHLLSEEIIKELYPTTLVNNCFVTNDIPNGICIETDQKIVLTTLQNIISLVAKTARNSQIQVAAKMYGDVILIQVKDHNTFNKMPFQSSLNSLQAMADQIGGFVGLSYPTNRGTTIAFSFPNLAFSTL